MTNNQCICPINIPNTIKLIPFKLGWALFSILSIPNTYFVLLEWYSMLKGVNRVYFLIEVSNTIESRLIPSILSRCTDCLNRWYHVISDFIMFNPFWYLNYSEWRLIYWRKAVDLQSIIVVFLLLCKSCLYL